MSEHPLTYKVITCEPSLRNVGTGMSALNRRLSLPSGWPCRRGRGVICYMVLAADVSLDCLSMRR